jgi:hypothetical protein
MVLSLIITPAVHFFVGREHRVPAGSAPANEVRLAPTA